HVRESFNIQWSSVVNAQYYLLEADDEPTFSYPINLTLSPIYFGTQSGALWGNPLTIYYRVRAVSVDGVRSLPSATRTVQITNAAPIPAGVSPVAPANGATVQLPFFFDWSDTPNPQVPGYDVEVNTSSNFAPASMVLLLSPSRSDYMITRDLFRPEEPMQRFPISPLARCRTAASPLESLEIYLPASPMVADRIRSVFFRFSTVRVWVTRAWSVGRRSMPR